MSIKLFGRELDLVFESHDVEFDMTNIEIDSESGRGTARVVCRDQVLYDLEEDDLYINEVNYNSQLKVSFQIDTHLDVFNIQVDVEEIEINEFDAESLESGKAVDRSEVEKITLEQLQEMFDYADDMRIIVRES